jgi:hypothetical protein
MQRAKVNIVVDVEEGLLAACAIELAQVVEHHLRLRKSRQFRATRLIGTQVAENTIPDPAFGDLT